MSEKKTYIVTLPSGSVVTIGDTVVDFRNQTWTFDGIECGPAEGKSAKVRVRDEFNRSRTFFAEVLYLTVTENAESTPPAPVGIRTRYLATTLAVMYASTVQRLANTLRDAEKNVREDINQANMRLTRGQRPGTMLSGRVFNRSAADVDTAAAQLDVLAELAIPAGLTQEDWDAAVSEPHVTFLKVVEP